MKVLLTFPGKYVPVLTALPPLKKLVPRGKKRGDWQHLDTATRRVVDELIAIVWPLLGAHFPNHKILDRCVGIVRPGAPVQPWHCDLDGDTKYHTAIIPLTSERHSGGTQFEDGTVYYPQKGTVYAFDGSIVHRGLRNGGRHTRLYITFTFAPAHWDEVDDNIF